MCIYSVYIHGYLLCSYIKINKDISWAKLFINLIECNTLGYIAYNELLVTYVTVHFAYINIAMYVCVLPLKQHLYNNYD